MIRGWHLAAVAAMALAVFGYTVVNADDEKKPSIPKAKYVVVDLAAGSVTDLGDEAPKDLLTNTEGAKGANKYKTSHLVLRRIPAGEFMMGSPKDELGRNDNETQHKVKLTKDYYIGVFPVTTAQFVAVNHHQEAGFADDLTRPTEGFDWGYTHSFCANLSKKLSGLKVDFPTEAQWEYACRAGTTTALNSGKNLTNDTKDEAVDELGWYAANAKATTHSVGEKKPNAWGLYDMYGNVWEFCRDFFGAYAAGDQVDPTGPQTGAAYVIRGGSWGHQASLCRSASRTGLPPNSRGGNEVGFRMVLELP